MFSVLCGWREVNLVNKLWIYPLIHLLIDALKKVKTVNFAIYFFCLLTFSFILRENTLVHFLEC